VICLYFQRWINRHNLAFLSFFHVYILISNNIDFELIRIFKIDWAILLMNCEQKLEVQKTSFLEALFSFECTRLTYVCLIDAVLGHHAPNYREKQYFNQNMRCKKSHHVAFFFEISIYNKFCFCGKKNFSLIHRLNKLSCCRIRYLDMFIGKFKMIMRKPYNAKLPVERLIIFNVILIPYYHIYYHIFITALLTLYYHFQ
jgi:hypothetical protein